VEIQQGTKKTYSNSINKTTSENYVDESIHPDAFEHLFYKIFHKYNNQKVKRKLISVLMDTCIYKIFTIISNCKATLKNTNMVRKSVNLEYVGSTPSYAVGELLYQIYLDVIKFGGMFIDIFMLRRFLDKSYITNGIYYCGNGHANNIVRCLLKYFDFTITHIANPNPEFNLKEVCFILKKSYYLTEDELKIFMGGKSINQCSNVTNFPRYFL
jgi:hypothetical protein